jgi:hypothetical protein
MMTWEVLVRVRARVRARVRERRCAEMVLQQRPA